MPSGDETSPTADDLMVQRRQWKAAITRHMRTLARSVNEEDVKGVCDRLDKMKVSFCNFEEVHTQYHDTLTDDTAIAASDKWFEDVDIQYNASVRDARQWLKSVCDDPKMTIQSLPTTGLPLMPAAPVATPASSHDTKDIVAALKVPQVQIDVFTGNPLEYQSFMSVFEETLSSSVADDQMRLTRLLQYTAGPAKAAIRNCALMGGTKGYQQARAILKNRFGSNHLISQKIIADLKSGKSLSKASDLQQLADDLTSALSVLEDIDMLNEIGGQQSLIDILQRCPRYIRNKWQDKALDHSRAKDSYPTFKDFVEFINKMAVDWGDPVYGRQKPQSESVCHNFTGDNVSRVNNGRPVDKCVLCGNSHRLWDCAKFKSMHPWQRFDVAKNNRLCFNCLLPNHCARNCKKSSMCTVPDCRKKHTKFLHTDRRVGQSTHPQGSNSSGDASNVGASAHSGSADTGSVGNGNVTGNARVGSVSAFGSTVFLPIVPVTVNGRHALALLDTGSTNTFLSEHLAEQLGLEGSRHKYTMSTMSAMGASVSSKCVSINVASTDGAFCQQIHNVLVVPSIPARYPPVSVDIAQYSHLSDIPIPHITPGERVDLLIGMDNSQLLIPLEYRRSSHTPSEPFAARSVFGWCLNGSISVGSISDMQIYFTQVESRLESLWHIENHDLDDDVCSLDDKKVIDLWDREICRDDDGHYVLPIPWKDGRPNLPNNKVVAKHRLNSLTKRLNKSDLTETYDQNMHKLIDSGYAEQVPRGELTVDDGSVWYLPHHPVISESKPGKVRPVFDCASKFQGVCLNDQCYQGPDLTNKLISVLLRFRQFRYAIMADIEAMYLQVRIPVEDRNALRFLWYDNGSVVEYRMTSHLFGGVWCSASSTYALRRTVVDSNPSALISNTIMNSFYVDDMLKSVSTVEEATEVIHGTREALRQGGFRLTKFTVNDQQLLCEIDVSDRAEQVKDLVPDTFSRALGVRWDIYQDSFQYVSRTRLVDGHVTRRRMLSDISSMYDPLGLISPVVIRGKMIFQEATRLRLAWDDPVPPGLAEKWSSWLSSLQVLRNIRFDRCVLPDGFEDGAVEMHHFADASAAGYGVCSYIRAINPEGMLHVALVAAKGRVAPLKPITIPRLELSAAVMAVKLDQVIRRDLEIPVIQSQFWSDSQIVLSYISNDTRRL